jgi:protein SCO1
MRIPRSGRNEKLLWVTRKGGCSLTFLFQRMGRQWIVLGIALMLGASPACNSSKPTETAGSKVYPLKGKVMSVDQANQSMVVDGEAIPGLMDAMAMPYKVKTTGDLDKVAVGDSITANVVMQKDDYFVQDIKVTQHSAGTPSKPASELHIPEPGDSVPNFELVNQNGKRIALNQYRGKTLLVTFIYTRCPFEDFCPRVSGQFAEIQKQMKKHGALYSKTHLLSISFDPKHDTPKVLRAYGAGYLEKKSPSFAHWEFAVTPEDELPDVAKFFGFTYTEEGGLITHSLSTAVIGPDGKIFKWYHGSDWTAADLLKDAANASRSSG